MCRPCWCGTFAVLGYMIALIMVAVVTGKAGRNIWSSDVKEIQRSQVPNNHGMGNFNPPNPTVAVYPPIGNPNYNVPLLWFNYPGLILSIITGGPKPNFIHPSVSHPAA